MKLKVPVNSYDTAVKQIESGADEIYMGIDDVTLCTMSYSARAQITSHGIHSTLTEHDFEKVVTYAHSKNVVVNFTVNCQHISNSSDDFFRRQYLRHVQKGISMGVDALIVSDIANLIYLNEHGIQTPIIAGSYLGAFNIETVNLLKQLGVFRVCLPDQVKLDEIKEIKSLTDLQIEVFIGYGCSNISGSCNFCHNSGEQKNVGVTCRGLFNCDANESTTILDACCNCAICSIPYLYNIKVDSIKLIGRETNSDDIFQITRMYRNAIDEYVLTGNMDAQKIISQISWWRDVMCPNRCKYKPAGIYRSYL